MKGEPIDAKRARRTVERHQLDWRYQRETGSTNADALEYYVRHRREVVAFSEKQSAGRGRRGRSWHSPFARNIYCTVGLLKALPANNQGLLSIVTGIALCRALRQSADAAIRLKWPNDLLFDGRKLGGILIESRAHDASSFFFAIGFGLNIFMEQDEIAAIEQPATSLDRASTRGIDRNAVLSAAIDAVVSSIRAFDPADAARLAAEFESFDAFHGREVEVVSGEQRIRGLNRGITDSGQLRLETGQGIQIHSAAEISLRASDP